MSLNRILEHQWRLEHLYWFKPKEGGRSTFIPNKFQQARYDRIYPKFQSKKGHKEIELKSRKFGSTTGCVFMCLDCTAYRKSTEAVTMAHKSEKATEIFNTIVRPAWDEIPRALKPRDRFNNRTEIDLMKSIRSKYIVSGDLKSSTPDILHLTEVAYFEDDEKIKEALAALSQSHGICVAESTGHGVGNWFETIFMEAYKALKQGKYHEWLAVFNPWFDDSWNRVMVHPEMTLKYESEARELQARHKLTDAQIFWWDQRKQEHRDLVYQYYPAEPEEAFLQSGRQVFSQLIIKAMSERYERPCLREENDIQVFQEPDENEFYGFGVDTAEGLAHGDNSVISVMKKSTGEEVAQCAGHISPHELAKKLGLLARMYRNHICIIERNNHGHTVIAYAKEDDQLNLYQKEVTDLVLNKITKKIGWDTTESSKSLAIDTLSRDLEDGVCIPYCIETYDELRTYVHGERGKMGGLPGKHDDRVIALALANMAAKESRMGDIIS